MGQLTLNFVAIFDVLIVTSPTAYARACVILTVTVHTELDDSSSADEITSQKTDCGGNSSTPHGPNIGVGTKSTASNDLPDVIKRNTHRNM
ncbi:hypothetical protein Y032_0325g2550 [Ancylostoma ceylanicum]|uniref:Secreted protein n=1 Tax=Ancylostoma ceylanicum TaxID=53326 RepID=A0A016S049_9BILA|nr:hypothetical protein Y032_0325g2550 [Ancylostoma ceylanicum]